MKKVGIIGHYGFGHDLANGQTIKTKIITEEIEKHLNEKGYLIDVHGGIKIVIPTVFKSINALKNCKNIIIMLTENGLKVCVPILSIFNIFFKRSLHYIVIGGWLASFLKKNKWLIKHLKKFKAIYVETNTMKSALNNLGLCNVIIMPNAKKLDIVNINKLYLQYNEPFKLCTFSRVMKEKGIEDIIYAIIKINEKYCKEIFNLSIFGEIDPKQEVWFKNLKDQFPKYITYKGVIPYSESVSVLQHFFALVFPTKFFTEGIPGTIIDAYAAGLPVISSKWESFADVVEDNQTGLGYTFGDRDDLCNVLLKIYSNPYLILEMKKNCIIKAHNYTLESTIKILKDELD